MKKRIALLGLVGVIHLTSSTIANPSTFRRGDIDGSGVVDITDVIATFRFLFLGDVHPRCDTAADADNSGALDVTDGIVTLGFLFLSTFDLPPPGSHTCGPDPANAIPSGGPYPEQPAITLHCDEYPNAEYMPDAACP